MYHREDHPRKHISISVTEDTSQRLKAFAARRGSNVSQVITEWIREQVPDLMNIDIAPDISSLELDSSTAERLETWAGEHHTTPVQAVKDWIWAQKIKDPQIKGQMRFF